MSLEPWHIVLFDTVPIDLERHNPAVLILEPPPKPTKIVPGRESS